ncbi:MAG: GNAT family N-acetyltransferase [Clostridia bacterium]|nr:GNAT family N-acetyltransferase [Clostridia bacterium]
MKMVRLCKITKSSRDYKAVKRIFLTAFPACERPPHPFMYLRSKCAGNDYLALYDENTLVGMSYVIYGERVVYIFFLAIGEQHRSKGYGTSALDAIIKEYGEGRTVVLAIEEMDERAENYPERVRRLKFYERYGFSMSGYKLREVNMVYDLLEYTKGADTAPKITPASYAEIPKIFLGKFLAKIFKMEIFKR